MIICKIIFKPYIIFLALLLFLYTHMTNSMWPFQQITCGSTPLIVFASVLHCVALEEVKVVLFCDVKEEMRLMSLQCLCFVCCWEVHVVGYSAVKLSSCSLMGKLILFCNDFQEMKLLFPNSQRINRGNYDSKQLMQACRSNEVTDFIVVHETRCVFVYKCCKIGWIQVFKW